MLNRRSVSISLMLLLALVLALFAANLAVAQDEATPEATPEEATPEAAQPFLGVLLSAVDDGARVEEVVAGSPAEDAGLQVGDVITAIGGEAVTAETARDVLAQHAVGDTVTLDVQRGDETLSLDVTLAERPQRTEPDVNIQIMPGMASLFGLRLEQTDEGLVVREVEPDSAAAEAGFEVGDVITKVGDTEIRQPSDILQALTSLDTSQPVTVEVQRGGETVTLEISLDNLVIPFGEGRGFAMPFDMPFGMMGGGARLGVQFVTLDEKTAEEHNVTQTEGALIMEVTKDSPAEKAGLQANDIVTAVDGDRVDAERTLRDRLLAYEPGDTVTLTVLRDGETMDVEVTLDEADFSNMMPGFRFFGPDGRGMGRGFMHPPIPGQPDTQPEETPQPNV
ncbi:MAG: PDZ domain-containing protein [Chloroflexi bacterium]|nr:PDZ domain-containing protein [Chloroflexota bacterium]